MERADLLIEVRQIYPTACVVLLGPCYPKGPMEHAEGFSVEVYGSDQYNVPPDGADPLFVVHGDSIELAVSRFRRFLRTETVITEIARGS